MDWSQIANNPLVLGAAAAVVVVTLMIVGIVRRRKVSASKPTLLTPQDVISQMGSMCPPFLAVMQSYIAQRSLATFLQQGEVSVAFESLERFLQKKESKVAGKDSRGLLHFEDAPTLENDVKASLITIARCIYADEAYQQDLDETGRKQFDELLDSLT